MTEERHEVVVAPPAEKPDRYLLGTPTIQRLKKKYVNHLRAHGNLQRAADEVGQRLMDINLWRRADPNFDEIIDQTLMALRQEHLPEIEANIFHLAKQPDPRLANHALKVAAILDDSWSEKKPQERRQMSEGARETINEWMSDPDILDADFREVE